MRSAPRAPDPWAHKSPEAPNQQPQQHHQQRRRDSSKCGTSASLRSSAQDLAMPAAHAAPFAHGLLTGSLFHSSNTMDATISIRHPGGFTHTDDTPSAAAAPAGDDSDLLMPSAAVAMPSAAPAVTDGDDGLTMPGAAMDLQAVRLALMADLPPAPDDPAPFAASVSRALIDGTASRMHCDNLDGAFDDANTAADDDEFVLRRPEPPSQPGTTSRPFRVPGTHSHGLRADADSPVSADGFDDAEYTTGLTDAVGYALDRRV